MKRALKKIIKASAPALQFLGKLYFAKPRRFSYHKVNAIVLPGVFFPHFTFSTKFLMDFFSDFNLEGKKFLELGCGCGVISVMAAKNGAETTATDVNPKALKNTKLNAERNGVEVKVIHSDLFKELGGSHFDFICINPPYFPKDPKSDAEKAWYCGADFQYFKVLFKQIPVFLSPNTKAYMILSEDCDFEQIFYIAEAERLDLKEEWSAENRIEKNQIFSIELVNVS